MAHSEGVRDIVPMLECKEAGKKLLELIWVDTDTSVDPLTRTFRSRLCVREYKTKKQGQIQRASLASQLFSAMPPLEAVKALVSIMISVGWSSKGETIEVETLRYQQSSFPRNSPETHIHPSSSRRSSEIGEDKVGACMD